MKQHRPHSNRQGQNDRRDELSVNECVKKISPMLNVKNATTEQVKTGVEWTEKLVRTKRNITSHQIRNIFTLIKGTSRYSEDPVKKLNTQRPMLAYIGARQKNRDGKFIVEVIDKLIVEVTNAPLEDKKNYLHGLIYIMESIVAYHKFHVGEN